MTKSPLHIIYQAAQTDDFWCRAGLECQGDETCLQRVEKALEVLKELDAEMQGLLEFLENLHSLMERAGMHDGKFEKWVRILRQLRG